MTYFTEADIERGLAEAREQGCPRHIEDPAVLGDVVRILHDHFAAVAPGQKRSARKDATSRALQSEATP